MKKNYKSILAVICFTAIILAGCENLDGSLNFPWTITWIAVALATALGYKRLEDAK